MASCRLHGPQVYRQHDSTPGNQTGQREPPTQRWKVARVGRGSRANANMKATIARVRLACVQRLIP